ncbi:MAG: 3-oxoacid CoA-transferase subunit A [Chloroflexi bacterium]|nr:3-oxoacid CoA-transferase subunit A [Chloroflexota bacterium]
MNKVVASFAEAVKDIPDGAVIMIGGFGGPGGMPQRLILALRDQGARGLTLISNTGGLPGFGAPPGEPARMHNVLVENSQVKRLIASFPVTVSPSRPNAVELAFREGKIEVEVVPQGTLAERIRAAGAGIPAFYTPTGARTVVAQGRETRIFDGRECLLEHALKADYAFIRAFRADALGNLVYKGSSRSFNAIMATAADVTIAEVDEILEPGGLDPEAVVTPGIYVDRIVKR